MKKQYTSPSFEKVFTQTGEYCDTTSSIVVEITPETGGAEPGTSNGYGGNQGSITDDLDG